MATTVQCLPLYGVLTKTRPTAQAHFAIRHASVEHGNKLTENDKTTLYPRGPSRREENKGNLEFPLGPLRFFMAEVREGDRGNNTVCRFDPCLICQAPRRITGGLERCDATKFVAFRVSSVLGWSWSLDSCISQSAEVQIRSPESPLLGPPRLCPLLLLFLN